MVSSYCCGHRPREWGVKFNELLLLFSNKWTLQTPELPSSGPLILEGAPDPTHWFKSGYKWLKYSSSRSCRPVNDLAEVILSVLLSNQALSTVGSVTADRALARGSRTTAHSLWCWWRGYEIVQVSLSGCWSQNINFNEWNMISTLFSWWFIRKTWRLASSHGVTPPLWPWHVTWPWHVLFQWGSA